MLTVVTGANGHVGSNLIRELLAQGRKVRAVVRGPAHSLDGLDVERVAADVRDRASLERAFEGADVVFHLAAVISISGGRDGLVWDTNVTGVKNAAEAALAKGVKRFVHCSSIHAFRLAGKYGDVDETGERSVHHDDFDYDRSKAAGERALREVVAKGLDAVVVNPTGIIGPYDYGPGRTGRLLLDLAHRNLPSLVLGAFDFVDVRDVVQGLLAAEKQGRTDESYILAGHWVSISELAGIARAVTGTPLPPMNVSIRVASLGVPFAAMYGRVRNQEPLYTHESLGTLDRKCRVSNAKARRELGFDPRPIEHTIRDTYDWFAGAGMLRKSLPGVRA